MTAVTKIPIIDTDTHVVEPPDLWTSRISSKWGDLVPHVKWDEAVGLEGWFSGDTPLGAVGAPAMAGWHEYPPLHPRRFADVDAAFYDPAKRAALMDEYNIQAALLYPNVAVFGAKSIVDMKEPELQLELFRAYNDYLTDFSDAAPNRFVPITGLPFWDLDATLAEIERCVGRGHKGIAFTQDPGAFGLPGLTDSHWDPMWASAQEKGLSVNFHIASGDLGMFAHGQESSGLHANFASKGTSFFMSNALTMALLIMGGVCHRFPRLNFVSVESGIGWIPFALESMDWQWKNCGVAIEHPEYDLLPSEYFGRQIYGCWWFENAAALHTFEQIGFDNVLYETDYPHPTSMYPGPATTAVTPDEYLETTFSGISTENMRKVLHDNAAAVYHLA